MGLKEEANAEIAQLRASYDPKAPDEGYVRLRLGLLTEFLRDAEQRDRVAAAPTLDVAGVSRRNRELQRADRGLTPLERAVFRSRVEQETDAIDRRVAELNPPPRAPPSTDPRAGARTTYLALRATSPLAAAAFLSRVGDAAVFDPPEPEAA
jgi:hypothetical protein